jgi:calreticulin
MIWNNLFLLSTIFLNEDFESGSNNWVDSSWKTDLNESGVFNISKFEYNETLNYGLTTSEDARFYAISKRFESFSNKNMNLSIFYTVANKQDIDCGGSYIKLFPSSVNQETLKGGSEEDKYNIMFGPDICGSTKKTHLIFNYNSSNIEKTSFMKCETGVFTHLYGLRLDSNGDYNVTIDGTSISTGNLRDDWNFLLPKLIKDPLNSKPLDWIDDEYMVDPQDTKPEGWDDIPSEIPDPDAAIPEDWNIEDDGEWEPNIISNPDYKGDWNAKKIKNPDYKGLWNHPMIENPDYKDDENIGVYNDFGVLAIEVWQVKSGSVFDNFLITDDDYVVHKYVDKILSFMKLEKEAMKMEESLTSEDSGDSGDSGDSEDSEDSEDSAPETPSQPIPENNEDDEIEKDEL